MSNSDAPPSVGCHMCVPDDAAIDAWVANLAPGELMHIAQKAAVDRYIPHPGTLNQRITDIMQERRRRPGQKMTQAMLDERVAEIEEEEEEEKEEKSKKAAQKKAASENE